MNRTQCHITAALALVLMTLAVPTRVCFGQTRPSEPVKPKGAERGEQSADASRGARRIALCIGIDHYECEGYSQLTCAQTDAKDLGAALKQLGYEVTVMTDDSPDLQLRPTYANFNDKLFEFTGSATNPDDTLLISFSGHGDKIDNQTGLLPLDYGKRHRLITLGALLDDLNGQDCRARKKLLILDACRSSAEKAERRLSSGFLQSLGNPESFLVLTGCSANQSSIEDANLGHGRLTAVLLEGLEGKAFAKDQEFLQADQLAAYVAATFRDRGWAQTQSPEQFGRLTAQVRFDVARRDLPKPPPLSNADRQMLSLALKTGEEAWRKSEYSTAVEYAATALRIKENDPAALALRAVAYLSGGYSESAEKDALAALAADPQQALAMHVKASIASLLEKNDLALELFQDETRLVTQEPDRWPLLTSGRLAAEKWNAIGLILCQRKDFVGGSTAFSNEIQTLDVPLDLIALGKLNRAYCYAQQKQWDKALAEDSSILELKKVPPTYLGRTLLNRAFIFRTQGQWEKAAADFSAVLAVKAVPEDMIASALLNRGGIYGEHGAWDKAEADFSSLLERRSTPHTWIAWVLLQRGAGYEEHGQHDKAIADYSRLIDLMGATNELVANAYLNRGIIYSNQKKWDQALADYSSVIATTVPSEDLAANAYYNRGVVYNNLEKWDKAVIECTHAIEAKGIRDELLAQALINRGYAYSKLKQWEKDLADQARVLAMPRISDDFIVAASNQRMMAYYYTHEWQKAWDVCDGMLKIKTLSPEARAQTLSDRGAQSYHLGNLDASLADCRAALEINPKLAVAEFNVAMVLLRQRKFDESKAPFAHSLALGQPASGYIDVLVELRDKLDGPPETDVVMGLVKIKMGQVKEGKDDLQRYLHAHGDGSFAKWAQELLKQSAP